MVEEKKTERRPIVVSEMSDEKVVEKRKKTVTKKDSLQDAVSKVRAKRAKLRRVSTRRDVLSYPQRPGFKRRVVNDVGGRIAQFEERGWITVQGDETGGELTANHPTKTGTTVSKVVGSGKEGAITGVLMEIPEEIYNEDQQEKSKTIAENEKRMEYKLGNDWEHNKSQFK